MRSNNCEPASSYKYFAGTRFGVVLKPSRTSVPNAETSVICGCGREERASATILPLVSFVSFIAHDLSENRFPLFGSCARPPVSRICVSILVCVCVCGQSCAGSNVPAVRRLPPCARTPMAIASSVSRLFSWPSAFHRLSGRVLRAAFLLRDILACELARSRDPTGINHFRSLPRRSASGTRAETHGECGGWLGL